MLITVMACVDASWPETVVGPGDPAVGTEVPTEPTDGVDPVDQDHDPDVAFDGGIEPPPEDPDEPDWDGSAPDGPEGMEVDAVVACTLFRDPVFVTFVKTDDPWLWEVVLEDDATFRVPELEPCYPIDGGEMPIMLWDPAPRITILSDGMVHTLEQSMLTDFWEGSVLPMEGSSHECDQALAELELEWPLPLTMNVFDSEDLDE